MKVSHARGWFRNKARARSEDAEWTCSPQNKSRNGGLRPAEYVRRLLDSINYDSIGS